ncbi:afadin-and alpha-actinin-binding protein [Nephila pilipes]|uniref:Afadin-and alpha-actinin-binding protein n=1 Tax=Nephila pilipes TaxID=299642 RepID=A0A8X6QTE8_NEPPI|nr:afadin-and alpha-actinin-binding protein [Nephila pilipes]
MNQARSIYQTDYVPFDWVENNFVPETKDFCSSENIDDCLRLLSQEFSALGYPSIYSNSTPCDYAVNCDIVKLLNVTFELIGNYRDHIQVRDDLENRNRRLFSDLSALNKKNSQLKESLEQGENKYKAALERERQMKEKNNRLLQTIKNEKEESKKLSSQIQQQKVTYQHEIRKYENNMNQMKARLNQILADKNPEKKIANISPSSLLQRNSKQRGKWKTGSVAKSCVEEMYSSVISNYENRCQAMMKEILEYRNGLECIQLKMTETISFLGGNSNELLNLLPLSVVLIGADLQKVLEERFQYLLNKLKETVLENIKQSAKKYEVDLAVLMSKISEFKKSFEDPKISGQTTSKESNIKTSNEEKDVCSEISSLDEQNKQLEAEKENLRKEKLEYSATIAFIEKEKTNLAMQKLDLIKLAIQQESSKSQWHQNLNTLPSFSVITTKDGSTAVPSAKDLKQCLSAPDQQDISLTPLWKIDCFETVKEKKSRSELTIQTSKFESPTMTCNDESKNIDNENSDLPRWAVAAMTSSSLPSDLQGEGMACIATILNATSSEELELSNVSSSEQNLDLLKAAMEDIASRRNHLSM